MNKYTINFEIIGDIIIDAESEDEALRIFSKKNHFELFDNAKPIEVTAILGWCLHCGKQDDHCGCD